MTEERDDDDADASDDQHEHNARCEQGPVPRVGRAGIRDERDAGDDGGKHRHPNSPAGYGALGEEVLVGRSLPPRDAHADADEDRHVCDHHEHVKDMHQRASRFRRPVAMRRAICMADCMLRESARS